MSLELYVTTRYVSVKFGNYSLHRFALQNQWQLIIKCQSYVKLKIKPCGLVLKFEIWRLTSFIGEPIQITFHFFWQAELALWDGSIIELKCQIVGSLYGVWPLTASMEVKNKYAYVITQDICNKFIREHPCIT